MTWVKIDDGFCEHEKVAGLSDRAFRLHVMALCYCARKLTDGHLTPKAVRVLGAELGVSITRAVEDLVAAGLWLPALGGHVINDYLEFNPPADKVRADRKTLSLKRREAGLKGAQNRWQKDGKPDGNDDGKTEGLSSGLSMAPSPPALKASQEPFAHANNPNNKTEHFNEPQPAPVSYALRAAQAVAAREAKTA